MQPTVETFRAAVMRYFDPIAKEHGWPLIYTAKDLFEIPSSCFVMRIHFGVGHGRSISVTLKPKQNHALGEDDIENELGLAVVTSFGGITMLTRQVSTVAEFFMQAEYVASMANRFAVPYLLGKKADWEEVKKFIQRKIEQEQSKIKKVHFPPFVQKRWHLPPPVEGQEE